jgi:hypothetical protein
VSGEVGVGVVVADDLGGGDVGVVADGVVGDVAKVGGVGVAGGAVVGGVVGVVGVGVVCLGVEGMGGGAVAGGSVTLCVGGPAGLLPVVGVRGCNRTTRNGGALSSGGAGAARTSGAINGATRAAGLTSDR